MTESAPQTASRGIPGRPPAHPADVLLPALALFTPTMFFSWFMPAMSPTESLAAVGLLPAIDIVLCLMGGLAIGLAGSRLWLPALAAGGGALGVSLALHYSRGTGSVVLMLAYLVALIGPYLLLTWVASRAGDTPSLSAIAIGGRPVLTTLLVSLAAVTVVVGYFLAAVILDFGEQGRAEWLLNFVSIASMSAAAASCWALTFGSLPAPRR